MPKSYTNASAASITYLKDVKASGTNGANLTSGSYQTRILNTQEGDTSFCTLIANQFILISGTYEITATALVFVSSTFTRAHKAKIRNITDSSDAVIGTSDNADANAIGVSFSNRSECKGIVTITSTKTFELQHMVNTSATTGSGFATSFGDNEVYAIVKIQKLA